MKQMRISVDLSLPLDWMTLSTVVYGSRGSGKTTFGRKVAEGAFAAGQRFCAIDLKGDWWGLKSSADGLSEGIPVVIFGGDHADLPLESDAGAFIAETVAGLHQPVILDLEYLSKGKQLRFLGQFFDRLYDKNRDPLLLLLDEAQRYAPQRPMSPEATTCLGAVEDLVKLGRKHGIGPVLFTQRGSGLNKEVSELCDMMVAFRTPGPLDQGRVRDWLEANATAEQAKTVMGQLSGLSTGTAVFASGHPDLQVFRVAVVERPTTFDSSATPGVGHRVKAPKKLAPVDLDVLRSKMAATIEKDKANDPKVLRARIVALEREVENERRAVAALEPLKHREPEKVVERIEVTIPAFNDADWARLHKAQSSLVEATSALDNVMVQMQTVLAENERVRHEGTRPPPVAAPKPPSPVIEGYQDDSNGVAFWRLGENVALKLGARRMLEVAARHHPVQLTRAQWATLSKMKVTGGTFGTYESALKRAGYIERQGDLIVVREAGFAAAGVEPGNPMSTAETLDLWRSKLKLGARNMLDVLVASYPEPVHRTTLAERLGMEVTGGTFGTYISTLKRNGLAEVADGTVRATSAVMGL